MKKMMLLIGLALFLAAASASAQMKEGSGPMGGPGMMAEQGGKAGSAASPDEEDYYQGYPGMMGGYGMGPGMMMGGRGMHPGMMMGPGMMGYGGGTCAPGYGMGPGMMGRGMMMGPGMMGPGWRGWGDPMMDDGFDKEDYEEYQQEYKKYLDETREMRKKMHGMIFDYNEARRTPGADREELRKMKKEMRDLRKKIYEKAEDLDD